MDGNVLREKERTNAWTAHFSICLEHWLISSVYEVLLDFFVVSHFYCYSDYDIVGAFIDSMDFQF